jgi:prenyltransferase beta subunit
MTGDTHYDQELFLAARKGFKKLSTESQQHLKKFVENAVLPDGSFPNREGKSDIYMTAFGIQLMNLLEIKQSQKTASYLRQLSDGEGLPFVHVSALARSWRFFKEDSLEIGSYGKIAEKLEYNRSNDLLWNQAFGTHFGSVYGTFLALLSYQNLSLSLPDEGKLVEPLRNLSSADGAFGTDRRASSGTTPSTAMATILLNYLEEDVSYYVSWLLKQQSGDGGFRAVSQMPFSDVQSTLYVLLALHCVSPNQLRAVSQEAGKFLLSMNKESGFLGHCQDTIADMENTYFALAGLGLID